MTALFVLAPYLQRMKPVNYFRFGCSLLDDMMLGGVLVFMRVCGLWLGPPEIGLPEGEEVEVVVADNSVVEIKCPFRSFPPPTVIWVKVQSDGRREEINSLSGGFTSATNCLSLGKFHLPPSLPPSLSQDLPGERVSVDLERESEPGLIL